MADILSVIAPVFLLVTLGYALGRTRLFPEGSSEPLINFVWWVGIPALLFRSLSTSELPDKSEISIVFGYYGALYIVYLISYLVAWLFLKQNSQERGAFSLSACFGNAVFIGIPIIKSAFGDDGVRLALVIISFHTITLLPVTTFIVEQAKTDNNDTGLVKRIFTSFKQNPILIALATGLTWAFFGLPVPLWLDRFLALPAQAAAPVGLFATGMALSYVKISGDIIHASTATILKLTLLPVVIYLTTSYIFDLPAHWVGTATLMGALPTGMIAYSFAEQQRIAPRRAATTVLLSTALSVFSLSMVLYLLKSSAAV
jgi:predicted permease